MSVHISADMGSNHCGSLELARDHVHAAQIAGATSIKAQLFRAESLDARPEKQARLKHYELPFAWLPILSDECHRYDFQFGCSVFALDLIEPLRGLVDFVKIASGDLLYEDLIKAAAGLGVPVVLSTGMASLSEVKQAVRWVVNTDPDVPITLLHCTSAYPCPIGDINLAAMAEMGRKAEHLAEFGLSDHSRSLVVPALAVALGATWIEVHFKTDDVPHTAPDFGHSLDPDEFAVMVKHVRQAEAAMGSASKEGPLEIEKPLAGVIRRTNEKRLRG